MRMRPTSLAILATVALAAAGCSSSHSSPVTASGTSLVTLSGTLGWDGGPRTPSSPPYHVMPGVVTLQGAGATRSVTADDHGRFSARVPRGTYVVTGTSTHFTARGVPIACHSTTGPVVANRDRNGILVMCVGT